METYGLTGLNEEQVRERLEAGLSNTDGSVRSKSVWRILTGNICTLFNLINFVLAAAVLAVGSYRNMLFMGVVACNLFIGIVQEIRAKRSVDRLALSAPSNVAVLRDSKQLEIPHEELVKDDIVILKRGEQIKADCVIIKGECDVNESFITGEADSVLKVKGDKLYDGSFVAAGNALAKVASVGKDKYISKISSQVKYLKKVNSEIMTSLRKIIRAVSVMIIPVGTLLFYNQYANSGDSFENAVINTVAALIGMIPEGLVLLASTVLAVAVIRLSRSRVLVQSLYCIETLARVDTLCLDKTGTITEGVMEYCGMVLPDASAVKSGEAKTALGVFVNLLDDDNPVFSALKAQADCPPLKSGATAEVRALFDSSRKWSGVTASTGRTVALGADGFVLKADGALKKTLERYEKDYRTLILAQGDGRIKDNRLPAGLQPVAVLLFRDKIRDGACETIGYFEKQGVELKVISGDSPKTVSQIAARAGIKNSDRYIDASGLSDKQLTDAAGSYTVFGRVSPAQKKTLVGALKKSGRTVAMTGDGVNDVMALKEADCSIAMASGTAAARNVSEIVLVDSDFSAMPKVVRQGRQAINNIQRSASLFLVKTIYSTLLAILFLFVNMPYPFIPIQLTLISALTIGIPSFVLALEPNNDRVGGRFLVNVLRRALPGGLATVFGIIMVMALSRLFNFPAITVDTIYVCAAAAAGLAVLFWTCIPFNRLRVVLFAALTAAMVAAVVFFKDFFVLGRLGLSAALIAAFVIVCIILLVYLFNSALKKLGGPGKHSL